MSVRKSSQSLRMLVQLSVLTAIMLLLEITNLGFIKTLGLEFTIMQVPVVIGAIVLGPGAGAFLGGVFGFLSFFECLGKSAFGAALFAINPFLTFLVCVPTRALMGCLCGLIFKGLYKIDRTKWLSFGAAALSGALLNTLLFMGTLLLCFWNTELIQGFANGANVFAFLVAFIGIQGLVEAGVCMVLGTAVSKALIRFMPVKKPV